MRIFYFHPLCFWLIQTLFYLVADSFLLALYHVSNIDFICQNPFDLHCRPFRCVWAVKSRIIILAICLFIFFWRLHMTYIQFFCDCSKTEPINFPWKYFSYNICCIRINHQTVLILRIFAVTIRGKCSNKFTFFTFDFLVASHFTGNVPAIAFIYKIFDWNNKWLFWKICCFTVKLVCNWNKTHI